MTEFNLDWACALGPPRAEADFRTTEEDFRVDEDLGFEPSGEGEHVFLHIEKRGENTAWLARQIAEVAGVAERDVGFAGLKDRRAVTRQWFSVYLPGSVEPDWGRLESDSVRVLARGRHGRKLRRGDHRGNRFVIRLRHYRIDAGAADDLQWRLAAVAEQGVPNYFGPQRFGREGNNLREAEKLMLVDREADRGADRRHSRGRRGRRGRQPAGIILSAARSWLFNQVLDARVRDGSWHTPQDDELLFEGAPTGPLWGRGRLSGSAASVAFEQRVLEPWRGWCDGLEHVGLSQERRALVLRPAAFAAQLEGDHLELRFALPPGGYATAILREVCRLKEMPAALDML